MTRAAVLLAFAVFAWLPAGTTRSRAEDTPEAIYGSFEAVLGGRDDRELYALPPNRYWRATGPLQIRLAGGPDFGLAPVLMTLADEFMRATGVEIDVQASPLAVMPAAGESGELTILIVARPLGAEFAAALGLDAEMRRRFADGRWPALLDFRRDDLSPEGRRRGILLLADDLRAAELETFLALSLVWTMGGAGVGDRLGDIVDIAGRPHLTERGRRVFALMYDPTLALGQPLEEVRAAARGILGLAE